MSEGDAFKRLAIVCGLMLTIVLLPLLVKKFTRRGDVVVPVESE